MIYIYMTVVFYSYTFIFVIRAFRSASGKLPDYFRDEGFLATC